MIATVHTVQMCIICCKKPLSGQWKESIDKCGGLSIHLQSAINITALSDEPWLSTLGSQIDPWLPSVLTISPRSAENCVCQKHSCTSSEPSWWTIVVSKGLAGAALSILMRTIFMENTKTCLCSSVCENLCRWQVEHGIYLHLAWN